MSLYKEKFLMSTPIVTREYTPGSRRKLRKTMRLPPCQEMQPDSPALRAEKFRVPFKVSKGCEAPCPDEAETYGFLWVLHRGFIHAFIL